MKNSGFQDIYTWHYERIKYEVMEIQERNISLYVYNISKRIITENIL